MPLGSIRPVAISDSMPLTSFGAAAEMRWTFAIGMSAARCFEVIAHNALQIRQRGGERRILRDAVAEACEQVLVHRRMIDAGNPAVAHDRLARHDQFLDVARGRARE